MEKWNKENYEKFAYKFKGLDIKKETVRELCKITGIWSSYIDFDDVRYF